MEPTRSATGSPTEYAHTHLRPEVAASDGYVDELIAPVQTRSAGSPERSVCVPGARMSDELLLTGATGFVGMEVLERYLERGRPPRHHPRAGGR